MHDMILHMG